MAKLQEACSLQPLPKPSVSSNSNPPSAEAAPSLLQAPMIRLPPRTSARGIPLWGKGSDGSPCSKPSWELSGTPHCRIKPRDLPWKEGSLSSSSPHSWLWLNSTLVVEGKDIACWPKHGMQTSEGPTLWHHRAWVWVLALLITSQSYDNTPSPGIVRRIDWYYAERQ